MGWSILDDFIFKILRPVVAVFSSSDDAVTEWVVGDSTGCMILKGTCVRSLLLNASAYLRRMEMGQVCIFTALELEPDTFGLGLKIVTSIDTEVLPTDPTGFELASSMINFSLPAD